MSIEHGDVYGRVQGLFQRGLVVVIGSGASCAYGLPSMGELSDHLLLRVPSGLGEANADLADEWGQIEASLRAVQSLEAALEGGVSQELADIITTLVADRVGESESDAVATILSDSKTSALGKLLEHALRVTNVVDVVTTNYDRLIEVHAARAGIAVDSMYFGHTVGRFDPRRASDELLRVDTVAGRSQRTFVTTWPHLRLAKPHGSLDWFMHGGNLFRSDLPLRGTRRIIAPGGNKYRLGYDAPFDAQRERANQAIDQASAFLFIGYGFNDEHLQTHIRSRFPHVPSVIVSRELTSAAHQYLELNNNSMGIQAHEDGCSVYVAGERTDLELPLWELEMLTSEVLGI